MGAHSGKVHMLDFLCGVVTPSSEQKPSKVNASFDIKFIHLTNTVFSSLWGTHTRKNISREQENNLKNAEI